MITRVVLSQSGPSATIGTRRFKVVSQSAAISGPPGTRGRGLIEVETRSGCWSLLPNAPTTTGTFSNGVLFFVPLDVASAFTINKIAAEVTTVGSAGSVLRYGLYADDGTGTTPGALLDDWGTIAATSLGLRTLTVGKALTPGRYWLAVVAQGVPVTNPVLRTSAATLGQPLTATPANLAIIAPARSGVTGALPTPAAPSTVASLIPRFGLLVT